MRARRSEESRHRLRRQHRLVPLDRRGRELHGLQGRSGRRRLPRDLDQPGRPRDRPAHDGPGRGDLGQRGEHLELLVQPADRPDVPRHGGRPLSLLGLRRPAGIGVRRCGEPRQRRQDHRARLAPGRGRGVRLRGARSAPSRSRLRREGDALRGEDGDDAGGRPRRAADRQVPVRADGADPLLSRRSARAVLRVERPLPDARRRPELGNHQSRSDARGSRRARDPRRLCREGEGRTGAASSIRSARLRATSGRSGPEPTTAWSR